MRKLKNARKPATGTQRCERRVQALPPRFGTLLPDYAPRLARWQALLAAIPPLPLQGPPG